MSRMMLLFLTAQTKEDNMNFKIGILYVTAIYAFALTPLFLLFAQEFVDTKGPRILHQPVSEPVIAGHPVEIKAKITDNLGVQSATLFYRITGTSTYSLVPMEPQGEVYVATIPENDVIERAVEYTIRAIDNSGITTFYKGGTDAPVVINVIVVLPPPPLPKEEVGAVHEPPLKEAFALKTEISPEKPWYKKRSVWAVATVVVGGIIAALSGGSGGGSTGGDNVADGNTTITITGPAP